MRNKAETELMENQISVILNDVYIFNDALKSDWEVWVCYQGL